LDYNSNSVIQQEVEVKYENKTKTLNSKQTKNPNLKNYNKNGTTNYCRTPNRCAERQQPCRIPTAT